MGRHKHLGGWDWAAGVGAGDLVRERGQGEAGRTSEGGQREHFFEFNWAPINFASYAMQRGQAIVQAPIILGGLPGSSCDVHPTEPAFSAER